MLINKYFAGFYLPFTLKIFFAETPIDYKNCGYQANRDKFSHSHRKDL